MLNKSSSSKLVNVVNLAIKYPFVLLAEANCPTNDLIHFRELNACRPNYTESCNKRVCLKLYVHGSPALHNEYQHCV